MAVETDPAQLSSRAVKTVAPHNPTGIYLVTFSVPIDVGQYSIGVGCQAYQPGRSIHVTALLVKIVRKN